jgi:Ca2+-binding EF-hand superfamily protein
MSLSRKHFKEIAKILGSNMASNDMIYDFADFCSSQNSYFQRQLFIDACEEHYQEAKKELEELINN